MNIFAVPRGSGTRFQCGFAMTLLLVSLVAVGCGVQSTSGVGAAGGGNADNASMAVPDAYFGMIVEGAATTPTIAYGSQRLSSADVSWPGIEPARGVFDFTALDARVATAAASGAEVVLTLGPTPRWASAAGAAPAAPTSASDWSGYVQAVASRYKGRVAGYEIWGVADTADGWTGSVAQMVELSVDAHFAIKAADPGAVVVSPSGDASWLAQYLDAGGTAAIDAVGSNASGTPAQPEAQVRVATALRTTMNAHGAGSKALWEMSSGGNGAAALSADDAESYVARLLILNWANGVSRVYWDSWDGQGGDSIPLTDGNGQANAAASAYARVGQWLRGAVMNGCATDVSSTWTCQISRGGVTEWIVWNAVGAANSSSLGAASLTDLSGNREDLSGISSISIGRKPVLLQ